MQEKENKALPFGNITYQFCNFFQNILDSKPSTFLKAVPWNRKCTISKKRDKWMHTLQVEADLPGAKDTEVLFGPIQESLRKQLPLLGLLLCSVKEEFCAGIRASFFGAFRSHQSFLTFGELKFK